jgi:hypothetical protein
MPITDNPNDPRLGWGDRDLTPVPQNEVYLVLSEEERAKGFVRPFRASYVHVGKALPKYPLRDLSEEEKEQHSKWGYVKFEVYPESESPKTGKFWTQAELDSIGAGCGTLTKMATPIAETYARNPQFYGATYCMGCQKHLPVSEFIWDGTSERVGS